MVVNYIKMFNAPMWWNGRHKGLKIPRWQQRTGSSPVIGTKIGSTPRGAANFGIGNRLTRPRPGDGVASRLVPVGDSSPRIANIPHDICVMGDAAFYSTSTIPSSLTVTVMPVLTYSRNSSPSWSTTGIFASVQTSASIAPDAARESIGILKSIHAGCR